MKHKENKKQTGINYIVSQHESVKELKRLKPEEKEEIRKLAKQSLNIYSHIEGKIEAVRKKKQNEILSTITETAYLVGKSKDQELAAEKGRLATERKQLRNIAENITKDLTAETPTAESKPKGESLVCIRTAIGNLVIGQSRVKQAARNNEIYSERSGTKKNSPYLVYKSEIERKFGVHGTK